MSKHITLNINFDIQKRTCSAKINIEVRTILTTPMQWWISCMFFNLSPSEEWSCQHGVKAFPVNIMEKRIYIRDLKEEMHQGLKRCCCYAFFDPSDMAPADLDCVDIESCFSQVSSDLANILHHLLIRQNCNGRAARHRPCLRSFEFSWSDVCVDMSWSADLLGVKIDLVASMIVLTFMLPIKLQWLFCFWLGGQHSGIPVFELIVRRGVAVCWSIKRWSRILHLTGLH
jgi:hypothetical protein